MMSFLSLTKKITNIIYINNPFTSIMFDYHIVMLTNDLFSPESNLLS